MGLRQSAGKRKLPNFTPFRAVVGVYGSHPRLTVWRALGPRVRKFPLLRSPQYAFFHPRKDSWNDHFRFSGPKLVGLTAIVRVTVHEPAFLAVREVLIQEGLFHTED